MASSGAGAAGSAAAAPQFVATALLGPAFAGWTVHMWLFGVVISRCWIYLTSKQFSKDTFWAKLVLVAIVSLDAGSAGIDGYRIMHYGVSQSRDSSSFTFKGAIDFIPLLLIGPIAVIVQTALVERTSRLFGEKRVWRGAFLSVSAILITIGWFASVATTVWNLGTPPASFDGLEPGSGSAGLTVSTLMAIWLWMSFGQDVCICLTLFHLLRRPHAGLSASVQKRFRGLSTLILRAGTPTAVVALVGAVLSSVFAHPTVRTVHVPLAFSGPLGSLYVIWLLACLEKRQLHAPRTAPRTSSSTTELRARPPLPPRIKAIKKAAPASRAHTQFAGAIMITTETSEMIEMEENDWRESTHEYVAGQRFAVSGAGAGAGAAREQTQKEKDQTSKMYNAVFA